MLMITGAGIVWATRGKDTIIPDTVPEAFVIESSRRAGRPPRRAAVSRRQPRVGPLRRAQPVQLRRQALVERANLRVAMTENTTVMPTAQASAIQTSLPGS